MKNTKDISFLIIGLGSIGKRHLRNLASLGIGDITVVSEDIFVQPGEELPDFNRAPNLSKALERNYTAAIIASPTAFHLEGALQAAMAGCHLFIEKPISHSMDGIRTLTQVVNQRKLIVQVGFQFRFHPALLKIKEWIDEGVIGKIVSVHSHWGEYLPGWHPWEDYRKGYSARNDLGGGVVLTLCHPFDYMRWLFGEVNYLYAVASHFSDLELDTEDTAISILKFASGLVGTVYLDYIERPARHDLVIIGQEGKITWYNETSTATLFTSGKDEPEIFVPPVGFNRNTMFVDQLAHFISCIERNEIPVCNLKDGVRALQIALAVKQSSDRFAEVNISNNSFI